MAVHEINSGEWTGGEAPAPKKSRFEVWTDHHFVMTLVICVAAVSLLKASDVKDQSWSQYWLTISEIAATLAISWGIYFGGFAFMYWVLLRTAFVSHLSSAQRTYLTLLAYGALFLAMVSGQLVAGSLVRALVRFL